MSWHIACATQDPHKQFKQVETMDHFLLPLSEMEAQQHALAAVEAVVQGLSPEQQTELRNQLDQVLSCVDLLRSEVAELRGGLQDIALQIVQDVK